MKKTLSILFAIAVTAGYAADHKVEMLDMKDNQPMVFDPPVLKIAPGDTVTFVPTHKSHWAESRLVPEGAEAFKGELDKELTVTFDKEGIYLYVCPPHQMMNMVGIIQVGKPVNLEEVKAALPKQERRAMSNKGRWEAYFKELDAEGGSQENAAANQPVPAEKTP